MIWRPRFADHIFQGISLEQIGNEKQKFKMKKKIQI